MAIDLEIVFLLDLIERLVVDVGVFVGGVGSELEQISAELGTDIHVAGIGEGLKDLGEQNIVIAEKLEDGFVAARPEPDGRYLDEQN